MADKIPHKPYGPYEKYIKRPLDVIFSGTALVLLSPVMVSVSVLVAVKLGRPVIFKQKRPGKDEKIFTLYKFRSMSDARDKDGNLLPDADRLTKFGQILRETSLDELPELFNILKGDMSFIGPRPLVVQYLPYYTKKERRRHSIRPGLTGLAQVHGRNFTTWEQRFHYDIKYVDKITFKGDLDILLKTIEVVFKRSGIGVRGLYSLDDFDVHRKKQIDAGKVTV